MSSAEKQPLLSGSSLPSTSASGAVPIEREEKPVPFLNGSDSSTGGQMITCKVCQAMIDITNLKEKQVVKCSFCHEATPIQSAPSGRKFVRCQCNCLLICRTTAMRVTCPRCKMTLDLSANQLSAPAVLQVSGICGVICAHCQENFLCNSVNKSLTRCPHCHKITSVGPTFARRRLFIYLGLTIVLFATAVGTVVGTYQAAESSGWWYVLYIGICMAMLFCLFRTIYYFRMKVSLIGGSL